MPLKAEPISLALSRNFFAAQDGAEGETPMNGLCLSCNTNHHECQDHPFIETVDELAEYVAGLFGMPAEVFHAVVRLEFKRQRREETFRYRGEEDQFKE